MGLDYAELGQREKAEADLARPGKRVPCPTRPEDGGDTAEDNVLRPGKVARERKIGPVRELTRADLAELSGPRPKVSAALRFRDSHHRVAILFAEGLKAKEVQKLTGYSLNRIIQLHNDVQFQELIAEYRPEAHARVREVVDEYRNVAIGNMVEAELQLEERLAQARDDNDLPSIRELVAITGDRADRFGYGKHQTNTNVNVDFAKTLESAIKRSGTVIDVARRPSSSEGSRPPAAHSVEPHRIARRKLA